MYKVIKIPKNLSGLIAKSKYHLYFNFFLELKTLYVSGSIHNESNCLPYQKICSLTGYSLRTVKSKIKRLKELDLLSIDNSKNIKLKKYTDLYYLLTEKRIKRVSCLRYTGEFKINDLVHHEAINENLIKQQHRIKQKLWQHYLKFRTGEINFSRIHKASEATKANVSKPVTKTEFKMIRAEFNANYLEIRLNYLRTYKNQMQSTCNGLPDLNPYTCLSVFKQGILFNRTKSGGQYWQEKLVNLGYLEKYPVELKTNSRTAEIERVQGYRSDIIKNRNFKCYYVANNKNYVNKIIFANRLKIQPLNFAV